MAHNPTEVALNKIEEYLRTNGGKVASLLSLGCGVFPPQSIGNVDMGTANPLNFLGRMNNLVTVLTTAVSYPGLCGGRSLGLNKDIFQALSTFSMHFLGGGGGGGGEGEGELYFRLQQCWLQR